ncbi:MAG: alpha/beta hydrolase-fold protein [Flavihumibacter sp.]
MAKVVIRVTVLPDTHSGEDIFLMGSFNNWLPDDRQFRLTPLSGNRYTITLPSFQHDPVTFRYNRGSWNTLECNAQGRLSNLRVLATSEDAVLEHTIEAWRDDFPASTASPQVQVLNDAFYIPQLAVHRRVWLYLPAEYATSQQRYPVIYMHDGQDLFDEANSRARTGPVEWEVDETIDASQTPSIVVAVERDAQRRLQECAYKPITGVDNPLGKDYIDFIVHTLKPFVDHHYRTLPGSRHTSIAGSSLGGLVSLYAALQYADVFGNAAVFSPSFWLDGEQVKRHIDAMPETQREKISAQRYYFYAGGRETRTRENGERIKMDEDLLDFVAHFRNKLSGNVQVMIDPEGRHGPWHWKEAFKWFYKELSNSQHKES